MFDTMTTATIESVMLPTPIDPVEETRRAIVVYEAARATANAAEAAFKAAVGPDVYAQHVEVGELEGGAHLEHDMLLVAELCRHLPAMAPAIRVLWMHVLDARTDRVGVCCTDGGPIER